MAFKLSNRFINIDRPFVTAEGVKYPHLRSAELRQKLGVVEVADEPTYDQRFYWGVDNPKQLDDSTETPEGSDTPVTTTGLKSQWIAHVKQTAGSLLAQTDWYIIRSAERQVAVPESVAGYRAAVVAEADRLEAAIAACADVPALIAVVSAMNWPEA